MRMNQILRKIDEIKAKGALTKEIYFSMYEEAKALADNKPGALAAFLGEARKEWLTNS